MLDRYENEPGAYLVQISSKHLSDADSLKVSKTLHATGDFERMGDHSVNLLHTAQELHGKKLSFSGPARDEPTVLFGAITAQILPSPSSSCRRTPSIRTGTSAIYAPAAMNIKISTTNLC